LAEHIVLLEEVGERPYRVDRMLTQLLAADALRDVAAVVVGQLDGCRETGQHDDQETLAVFREPLGALGVPVVAGAPVGHGTPNLALPLGGLATLSGGDKPELATASPTSAA